MEFYSQMLECLSARDVARPILDRVTKQVKCHRPVSEKDIAPVVAAVHRSELLFDSTNEFSLFFHGRWLQAITHSFRAWPRPL